MNVTKSTTLSLLQCKCPQCHSGDLFICTNPYILNSINKMPDQCPVCDLDLIQEMGFYWGAMYVSYVLTVALSFFNFVWVYFFWGWLTWQYMIINTFILLITLPLMFRYSRVIWLYLFGKYQSRFKK